MAFSKISKSRNRKSFLIIAKSLGYTPEHLQKYRCSRQIQKGY